jgi:tetratricopeptide (TPR) repeat protein
MAQVWLLQHIPAAGRASPVALSGSSLHGIAAGFGRVVGFVASTLSRQSALITDPSLEEIEMTILPPSTSKTRASQSSVSLRALTRLLAASFIVLAAADVHSSADPLARPPSSPTQAQPSGPAQREQESPLLELKKELPYRTLVGGEVHSYRLKLDARQYVRVQGYFSGVDAVMTLYGPDGAELLVVTDPRSVTCQKSIMWSSKAAGEYRVEVRALDAKAAAGNYTIYVQQLLSADEQNKNFIAADRATEEGWRLHEVGTQEALRQAIGKFEDAIPRWRALGDIGQEFNSLMYLGEVYFNLSEYQTALDTYEQVLPLLKQEDRKRIFPVWTYNNVGRTYEMFGEPEKALRYFELSLSTAEQAQLPRDTAIALTSLGALQLSQGEKQKAFDYLNRATPYWQKAFEEGPDISGGARVLLRFGELYASLGEREKALDYFRQAAEVWRSTSDPVWLVRALNGLGSTQHAGGDFKSAIDTFREASGAQRAESSRVTNLSSP